MRPTSDITRMPWLACRTRVRWFLTAACGAALLAPACGVAQQTLSEQAGLINWWYSAAFGTGFYQIGPAIATVVRFPVSYRLREMQGDQTGIKAIVPVTLAAYHLNFNDIEDFDIKRDVAAASVELAEGDLFGIWHIAGPEVLDRYTFALRISREFGLDTSKLTAVTTAALNQKAPRPLDGGLKVAKAQSRLKTRLRGTDEGLRAMREAGAGVDPPRNMK